MEALFGIVCHTPGGISSGSFYMPYNKVKKWSRESYWKKMSIADQPGT